MRHSPAVVSLPIADRQTSYQFYRDGHSGASIDQDGHVWLVTSR